MKKSATISKCKQYRYELTRSWSDSKKVCTFIMLNPSKADAEYDDPTILKCINFSKKFGCDSLSVVNLFAYRSTDKSAIKKVDNPIGPENDSSLLKAAQQSSLLIVAWGDDGQYRNRSQQVLKLLKKYSAQLYCLKINKSGEPSHPLYLSPSLNPIPYH